MALTTQNNSLEFDHVLHVKEGESISLPAGFIVEQGGYDRAGSDLILSGENGQSVLIENFFNLETVGINLGSGFIPPHLAERLSGPLAPGQYAQATPITQTESIGQIETVDGSVSVVRADGSSATLKTGDPIYQGDIVRTADGASVGITFKDDSTFSLDENGEIALDEMVYDPDTGDGSFTSTLTSGVFSFVSGQIAKANPDAMAITTPVATIGIRGTQGVIKQDASGPMEAALLEEDNGLTGELTLTNGAGTVVLNQPNQFSAIISFTSAPSQPVIVTSAQITGSFGAKTLAVLRQTRQRLEERKAEEEAQQTENTEQQGQGEGEGEGEGEQPVDGPTDDIVVDLNLAEPLPIFIPINVIIEPFKIEEIIIDIIKELERVIEEEIRNDPVTVQKTIEATFGDIDNWVTLNYNGTLIGSAGEDIYGTAKNDGIAGLAGNDTIYGMAGNDAISGGEGSDYLYGDAGDDAIHGDAPVISGDYQYFSHLLGLLGASSLGDNTYGATDYIYGGAGNDIIDGGVGNDYIYGDQSGTVYSTDGADIINGGTGDDYVYGGGGNDTISGDDGADHLYGDVGNDVINGGIGADTLFGDAGNDTLNGGNDIDSISGGSGDDIIYGESGADTLRGDGGTDIIYGGDDNDTIFGYTDTANNTYAGGNGTDHLELASYLNNQNITLTFAAVGTAQATYSDTTATTYGTDTITGIEKFTLDGGADTVVVNATTQLASTTTVAAGAGNDTLKLNASMTHDFSGTTTNYTGFEIVDLSNTSANVSMTIDHTGVANLTSSTTLTVNGDSGDTFSFVYGNFAYSSNGSGYNVFSGNSKTINVQDAVKVKVTGSGTFEGSAMGETLVGSSGADTITDKDGADSIDASTGNDTVIATNDNYADHFDGCAGTDTLQLEDNANLATITLAASSSNSSMTLQAGGTDTFTGFEIIEMSDVNDTITLNGASGYTTLDGNLGADNFTIAGSSSADTLLGGAGTDTFDVNAAFTGKIYGGADADTFDLAAGVTGTIWGEGGNDIIELRSGGSVDQIYAGLEVDQVNLRGGSATLIDLGDQGDTATIYAGSTVSTLDGGTSVDTLTYDSGFGYVATWNLTGTGAGTLTDTNGTSIAFQNFENIISTAQPDTITASGGTFTTLDAGSGADSLTFTAGTFETINGGNGNDNFTVSANTSFVVSGTASAGAGDDTLTLTDVSDIANLTFDAGSTIESTGDTLKTTLSILNLTTADSLSNFEILDLGVGSTNTHLMIDSSFNISSGNLLIEGDANDSIDLGGGWIDSGSDSGSYSIYNHGASGGDIKIYISNNFDSADITNPYAGA